MQPSHFVGPPTRTGRGRVHAQRVAHSPSPAGMERGMGRSREAAEALEGLAAVAVAQGRPERAVRMGAAAAGLRASMGTPMSPYDRAVFERTLDAARASLGTGALDA